MTHELVPLLRYQDIVSKGEAVKLSDELGELLYIDLPEADTEPLKSLEDKLNIEIRLKNVKSSIDAFINELKMRGYKKAKTFVENAKGQLFTYNDNWIKTGISNPKVTSLVERTMREIKQRIKKIGFKWSEKKCRENDKACSAAAVFDKAVLGKILAPKNRGQEQLAHHKASCTSIPPPEYFQYEDLLRITIEFVKPIKKSKKIWDIF